MASLKISHSLLAEALANIVRDKSVGMADMDITAIRACIAGEYYELEGLEIDLAPKTAAPTKAVSKFTPPAGVGKIRLATVNGEQA